MFDPREIVLADDPRVVAVAEAFGVPPVVALASATLAAYNTDMPLSRAVQAGADNLSSIKSLIGLSV